LAVTHITKPVSSAPKAQAEIQWPAPNQRTPADFVAHGVAKNLPPGDTLWLIGDSSDGYYPQAVVPLLPGGTWAVPLHPGTTGPFGLLLVEADAAASDRFTSWISEANRTGTYNAMVKGADYPNVDVLAAVTLYALSAK
jgi:hypothetical protein